MKTKLSDNSALRNICMLVAFGMLPTCNICAQEVKDSVTQTKNEVEVSIKRSELQKLWSDQEILEKTKDSLAIVNKKLLQANELTQSQQLKITQLETQLLKQTKDNESLNKQLTDLKAMPVATDKHLIDMAANFLFIPYEDYSINRIAIPAFEFVQSQRLKAEYSSRLDYLKTYLKDLNSLADFLKRPGLGKNKISAGSSLDRLKTLPVYEKYKKYDWLQDSYLNIKINQIEKELTKVVDTGSPGDFSKIINELNNCLSTVNQ